MARPMSGAIKSRVRQPPGTQHGVGRVDLVWSSEQQQRQGRNLIQDGTMYMCVLVTALILKGKGVKGSLGMMRLRYVCTEVRFRKSHAVRLKAKVRINRKGTPLPKGIPLKGSIAAPRKLRSQPTRDAILAAARRLFAADGFDRTTIRAVAAEAGIHPSMVMRYHGTKEGLFAAAASFDLQLPDLSAVPRSRIGEMLVRHFLDRWERNLLDRREDNYSGDELSALLRVAATHEQGRERLQEIFKFQVAPAIAKVCAPARAKDCAALIGTQLLGLALTRSVLGLAPMLALEPAVLVKHVGAAIQGYIDFAKQ
jgi:AcrR family transcriptional regulator